MKILSLSMVAALFTTAAAADAQIAAFSVNSHTASSGDRLQIAGLFVSQSSPLSIGSTPAANYSGIGGSSPNFNINPGDPGTVLAWGPGGGISTTSITSSSAHIVNCSGRFWVQQPFFAYNGGDCDEGDCWNTADPGYGGDLDFVVQSGGFFSVDVMTSVLSNYGLTGVAGVRTTVSKVADQFGDAREIAALSEGGTASLHFLTPGRHRVSVVPTKPKPTVDPRFSVVPDDGTRDGHIVVSINAQ